MQIISPSVSKLWNLLEIRILVLLSLVIQSILTLTGNKRKYSASDKLSGLLWVTYMVADWAVTVSLSVLSNHARNSCDHSIDPDLVITLFWAPFLLLHLGGPDTITAYSLEDNELWRRHALMLVSQVVVAAYVLLKAWTNTALNSLAIPVFVAGVVKSVERIWVLWSASSEKFRESMLSPPDPGPNYARYMEEYSSKKDEGFEVSLEKLIKLPIESENSYTEPVNNPLENADILQYAYGFFETFKLLFADLILSFHDIEKSQSFFMRISSEDAFKVIEVELGFIYDVFYTKAVVVYSFVGGFFRSSSLCCLSLRCFTFISIMYVSLAFLLIIEKHEYSREDVVITYVLLAGAIILELYAVILKVCSDWMMLTLKKHNLLRQAISSLPCTGNKRWSNTMAQCNLISICLEYKPAMFGFITKLLCIDGLLEKHRYKFSEKVPAELKEVIFDQLSKKSRSVSDIKDCKKFCDDRGYEVIESATSSTNISDGDRETIKESVDKLKVEFDKSILLWHIATDLCFYSDQQQEPQSVQISHCKASKLLSNYMLYLLVVYPFMLPNGIGQIRFRDTCAEAKEFFKERKSKLDQGNAGRKKKNNACSMLLQVSTEIPPSKVKGDRSKSVLFEACRLAKSLQSFATAEEWDNAKKWELICHVWVEILSYAASHCQWNHHAQQLTQGGELLTHVWLLMAHLGITEQFQISQGHERAKLNVE